MIRFNPYDVKKIDFINHQNLPAFIKLNLQERQADILQNTNNYHYIYDKAFKISTDSEKLFSSDNLTEAIYIQEVRAELRNDSFLNDNVFKKSNAFILPHDYKIQYYYNTVWTSERIGIELETNISNRLVLLMKDDCEILYIGLVDVTDNSINSQDEIIELKLYSQNYLLKKIENITVPMFDKNTVSQYGTTTLFGLFTGEQLRNPSKMVELYIREAFRYFYYGENETNCFNFNSIADADYISNKYMNKDFIPLQKNGYTRYYYSGIPNGIWCIFSSPNLLHILYEGTPSTSQRFFRIYKCFFDDDFNMLNPGLVAGDTVIGFTKEIDTTHQYIMDRFRELCGVTNTTSVTGTYYFTVPVGSLVALKVIPNMNPINAEIANYRIEAQIPAALDLDICNGSTGVAIKITDLIKLACIMRNAYIDYDGLWNFAFKKRDFVSPDLITLSTNDIAVLNRKNVYLNRDNFSGLDILNMSNDANDLLKKLLKIDYNKTILKSISEEMEVIINSSNNELVSGKVYQTENNDKFFIIEIEPNYNSTGIINFRAKVWKVEESDV